MLYLLVALIVAFPAFKLGMKYKDFQDLMTARRLKKLMEEQEQFKKEMEDYERAEEMEKKLKEHYEKDQKLESVK